jgi:glutamate synthase domain-containing protein 1
VISVLIVAEGRGWWSIKARPGETERARDALAQLEQRGAVDAATAAAVGRVLDALDGDAAR